jgi:putative flippase GtrA
VNNKLEFNQTLQQFVTFVGAGAVATIAHYVVLIALVEIFLANAITASTTGYAAGAIVNYALNYRFTFRSTKPHYVVVVRFITIAAIGMALNSLVVSILINEFAFHYFVAQLVATGVVLLWNFVGNRFWAF